MAIAQLQLKLQDYHRAMKRLRVAVNSKMQMVFIWMPRFSALNFVLN